MFSFCSAMSWSENVANGLRIFPPLGKKHERSITASNLYRYLAVMLFSQCTGCSFTKRLDMLGKLGGQRLDEEILNYINNNILAYAATGRGEDNSLVTAVILKLAMDTPFVK